MNKFGKFLKDHILVSLLYLFTAAFLIGFYCLTTKGSEVIYPIFIVLFFYVLYMTIAWIFYLSNHKKIEKLSENAQAFTSRKYEYKQVYDAMNQLHNRYNTTIAKLSENNTEDKRFISGYIHNLKTPVTVSSIIVQRSMNGEIKPEDAVTAINVELERLDRGLNMLLDLQRIEELERDYEPLAIDIAQDVRTIINANKSLFIHSGVYPVFESESEWGYTDSKWNNVLVSQIVSNAVKYSKQGDGKHIYFDLSHEADRVILTIRDEGIGIPEVDLPRVFDPFFTGENGRKGYNSSGIGLYLCKTICDRLGHTISIKNDHGCKVTISYLAKM